MDLGTKRIKRKGKEDYTDCHVINIWVLGNHYAFMTVVTYQGHVIANCHLPSRLTISKVNVASRIHLKTTVIT